MRILSLDSKVPRLWALTLPLLSTTYHSWCSKSAFLSLIHSVPCKQIFVNRPPVALTEQRYPVSKHSVSLFSATALLKGVIYQSLGFFLSFAVHETFHCNFSAAISVVQSYPYSAGKHHIKKRKHITCVKLIFINIHCLVSNDHFLLLLRDLQTFSIPDLSFTISSAS